jgi:hypothetical protein
MTNKNLIWSAAKLNRNQHSQKLSKPISITLAHDDTVLPTSNLNQTIVEEENFKQ